MRERHPTARTGDQVEDADEQLELAVAQLEVGLDEALRARHDADVVPQQEGEGRRLA